MPPFNTLKCILSNMITHYSITPVKCEFLTETLSDAEDKCRATQGGVS